MNCKEAKEIKIIDFFAHLGIKPVKTYKQSFLYSAPYREDKNPSFSVSLIKNIWTDLALGKNGDLVDLIKLMYSENTSQALQRLEHMNFSNISKTNHVESNSGLDILEYHLENISSKHLIDYIISRKLKIDFCRKYLKEINYKIKKNKSVNTYRALAFQNDSNGYEIRNKYFKGCLFTKDITSFKFKNTSDVNVFEGVYDFLAMLTNYNSLKLKNDTIILNSTSLITKIDLSIYNKINLFLDNDKAGDIATNYIEDKYSNKTVIDNRILYKQFKDYNDSLSDS